jgi:hypothetical protein
MLLDLKGLQCPFSPSLHWMEKRGLLPTADEDLAQSISELLRLERLQVGTTQGAKPLQTFHGRLGCLDQRIRPSNFLRRRWGNFRACCPASPFAAAYIATTLAGDYFCTSPPRLASCRSC